MGGREDCDYREGGQGELLGYHEQSDDGGGRHQPLGIDQLEQRRMHETRRRGVFVFGGFAGDGDFVECDAPAEPEQVGAGDGLEVDEHPRIQLEQTAEPECEGGVHDDFADDYAEDVGEGLGQAVIHAGCDYHYVVWGLARTRMHMRTQPAQEYALGSYFLL